MRKFVRKHTLPVSLLKASQVESVLGSIPQRMLERSPVWKVAGTDYLVVISSLLKARTKGKAADGSRLKKVMHIFNILIISY